MSRADLIELGGIYERLSPFGRDVLLGVAGKYEQGEREHGSANRADMTLRDWLVELQKELIDGVFYIEIILKKFDVPANPGSDIAVQHGCKCPRVENCFGKGYREQPGSWVKAEDCPLHGGQSTVRKNRTNEACACGHYCERCEQS